MPPLPNVTGVVRTTFKFTLGSDTDVLNRLFHSYTGTPPTVSQLVNWADLIGTAFHTRFNSYLSNQMTLSEVEAVDLASTSGAIGIFPTTLAFADSNPPLAAGSALRIGFTVARRYRGGHPAWYMAGLLQNMLNNVQTFTSGALTTYGAQWGLFTGDVAGININSSPPTGQVNVSYFQGFTNVTYPSGRTKAVPKLRTTPVVDPIISYTLNPNVASQRRRNQIRH